MNQVHQISCKYITPNKTIETLSISCRDKEIITYIYNYKGVSFRVFTSRNRLEGFWKGLNDDDFHFGSEEELDYWLKTFDSSHLF